MRSGKCSWQWLATGSWQANGGDAETLQAVLGWPTKQTRATFLATAARSSAVNW